MRIVAFRVAFLILAGLSLSAAGAEVYKCTDENGKVHYLSRPCPDAAKAETLQVTPPATPDPAAAKNERKTLEEQIAEATDPVVKARLQIQKQECDLAATQMQRYEDAPYLIEKLEDGTDRRLSDEEAQAEKDKLRRLLDTRC